MKLSPARFVTIEGTEVHAHPANADEAKLALKELRQKKKEFALRRRALMAAAKKARDAAETGAGASGRTRKKSSFVAAVTSLLRRAKARKPRRELAAIESDIHDTDEILFNLDSCAVQIEGKLLHAK